MKQKVGRNDPCPCGSGKKFKKCCMGKLVESSPLSGFNEDVARRCIEEDDMLDSLPPFLNIEQFSCLDDALSSIGINDFPDRVIPCSSEYDAFELSFKLSYEGHRCFVFPSGDAYEVHVFD